MSEHIKVKLVAVFAIAILAVASLHVANVAFGMELGICAHVNGDGENQAGPFRRAGAASGD